MTQIITLKKQQNWTQSIEKDFFQALYNFKKRKEEQNKWALNTFYVQAWKIDWRSPA